MSVVPQSSSVPFLPGLADISAHYRGAIIDLWGVLHDGVAAFPDAIGTLERLRAEGVRICLLSNAPRRAPAVIDRLAAMGIRPALYDRLITSGEVARAALIAASPWPPRERLRYFHLGPDELAGLLNESGLNRVLALDKARVILCTGYPVPAGNAEIDRLLRAATDRKIPMVCANPDRIVHVGNEIIRCAGSIAADYEALGGRVRYFGKPHLSVYRAALNAMGFAEREVLAIGDSLATDIRGATRARVDTVMVLDGIHRDELAGDEMERDGKLAALCRSHGCAPTFVIDRFRW